jgi:hypothetical protein
MHKLECRSGGFSVFHVGKMAFTVENDAGQIVRRFSNLSDAAAFARWLHSTNAAFI